MKLFLSLLLLLGIHYSAQSTTYIIASSDGNDTSLQHFMSTNTAAPGDIIQVNADTVGGTKIITEALVSTTGQSGTVSNWVTIQGRIGDTIIIDGQNTRSQGFNVSGSQWIKIKNFWFTNCLNYDLYAFYFTGTGGAGFWAESNHFDITLTVTNSMVRCALGVGGRTDYGKYDGRFTNVVINGNIVTTSPADIPGGYNMGDDVDGMRVAGCKDVWIYGNTITKSCGGHGVGHDDGLQIWDLSNVYLYQNTIQVTTTNGTQQVLYMEGVTAGWNQDWHVYDNVIDGAAAPGAGMAFQFATRAETNSPMNEYIYNNVIIGSRGGQPWSETSDSNTNHLLRFKNNFVIHNNLNGPWYAVSMVVPAINTNIDYNIYYCPNAPAASNLWSFTIYNRSSLSWNDWRALGFDAHSLLASPAPLSGYIPQAGSPLLGAGVTLTDGFPSLNADHAGAPRTAPWTIGAYQTLNVAKNLDSPSFLRIIGQ